MIYSVSADQPSFKTATFTSGFNVVVAERNQESTKKDSRNGLGKTSLIEIIHFCLGANARPKKGLRREPLDDWTFYLDIDLRGQRYLISRNTHKKKQGRVYIEGNFSNWPIAPKEDVDGNASLSVREWNIVLGWLAFDLTPPEADDKYLPTFRSLVSYFIRKGRDAYSIPFEHFRKQLNWDKQVNNAFLLGLGWEYAQRWQLLKDKEKAIKQLKDVAKSGLMPNLVGRTGDLETTLVRLEEQARHTQTQLDTFQVHPQYSEIEERANQMTSTIHQLSNANVQDRQLLQLYEENLADEQPASNETVSQIYEEAGIVLPERIVRRFDEVQTFHEKISADRRTFLERERQRLTAVLLERETTIRTASEERASLMEILQTHGALEEYTKLQQQHLQRMAELEEVRTRLGNLQQFEREQSTLKIEAEQLLVEARSDHEERREIRERAISLFNANSEALYKSPGNLIINTDTTGFKFQVEIERSTSQGIEQMKVFCYDLTLAQLWAERKYGLGVLIHDSTIFDGVDERQVAQALELAARTSTSLGFQYICCLNSDQIPHGDFSPNFDLDSYKRLELTDATPTGGLFGIRF